MGKGGVGGRSGARDLEAKRGARVLERVAAHLVMFGEAHLCGCRVLCVMRRKRGGGEIAKVPKVEKMLG